jgi:hypothetical protein
VRDENYRLQGIQLSIAAVRRWQVLFFERSRALPPRSFDPERNGVKPFR